MLLISYLPNIIFFIILSLSLGYFISNVLKLRRNINLGIDLDIDVSENSKERWMNMARIALGQSKMVRRPIAGALHVVVYIGFIIINIELIEIVIDGLLGTHRIFSFMGWFYGFLISSFEILAILVVISVSIFWLRRNIIKLKRFYEDKMKGWPKLDADLILYFEIILMSLFLLMNATDVEFQKMNNGNIISGLIFPLFESYSVETLHILERIFWWSHIIGILFFLNYLIHGSFISQWIENLAYTDWGLKPWFSDISMLKPLWIDRMRDVEFNAIFKVLLAPFFIVNLIYFKKVINNKFSIEERNNYLIVLCCLVFILVLPRLKVYDFLIISCVSLKI